MACNRAARGNHAYVLHHVFLESTPYGFMWVIIAHLAINWIQMVANHTAEVARNSPVTASGAVTTAHLGYAIPVPEPLHRESDDTQQRETLENQPQNYMHKQQQSRRDDFLEPLRMIYDVFQQKPTERSNTDSRFACG